MSVYDKLLADDMYVGVEWRVQSVCTTAGCMYTVCGLTSAGRLVKHPRLTEHRVT